MRRVPEPGELDPAAAGLIQAGLTRDTFATDRILTRGFEDDADGLFFASRWRTWQAASWPRRAAARRRRLP